MHALARALARITFMYSNSMLPSLQEHISGPEGLGDPAIDGFFIDDCERARDRERENMHNNLSNPWSSLQCCICTSSTTY
jgi:hypothetical protein